MPQYTWIEKKSGKTVDVLRRLAEYQDPPTRDEAKDLWPGVELDDSIWGNLEWEREIGGNQTTVGFGMKGYWILAFLILSFSFCTIGYSYNLDLTGFTLLEAEGISIDAWKTKARRDPYQPELTGKWTTGGAFNLDLRVLEILRWENHLHMDGVESRLRNVGWEFSIFMDYFDQIQPFIYHHSEHSLDEPGVDSPYTSNDFPVKDMIGIRFIFLNKAHKK